MDEGKEEKGRSQRRRERAKRLKEAGEHEVDGSTARQAWPDLPAAMVQGMEVFNRQNRVMKEQHLARFFPNRQDIA